MSTLVLGLGNLVHADDGVGVHAIERLQSDARVPAGVTLIDGGTHGLGLLPYVAGFDRVLVIDAVDVGAKPGTLIRLEGRAIEKMPGKPSVHQLGFADMLIALKLLDERPPEVIVIGVQPLSTDWSAELTPTVQQSLEELTSVVITQLNEWALEPATL